MATKKKKLKKIDPHTDYGVMETPTIQYHYGETGPFIPKTYTCSIKSVTEQIIREYLRAKKEEKRIETKVEVETERAVSAETKLESGITANTASIIANAQAILNNLKLINDNTEAIKTETTERKEETAEIKEEIVKIEEKVEEKVKELSEEDQKLYEYIKSLDEEVDSIKIETDEEDNRKYYLKIGGQVRSEFRVPNDGYLRNVTFDEETSSLVFTVGDGVEERIISTDLSSLVDKYQAGYGLSLNDNVFSVNINENSSFIYMNENNQLDFGMKVIKNPYDAEDIWDYYIVGKDDKFPTYNSAKFDLHPIGDYLDKKGEDILEKVNEHIDERADEILATVDDKVASGVIEAKDYTDSEIDALRKEIEDKLNTLLIAGNNIKLDKDSDGNVTISVKIDSDIHVKDETLLVDNLPSKGDTLDNAIIKVLNNVVTNADTSDGEVIDI